MPLKLNAGFYLKFKLYGRLHTKMYINILNTYQKKKKKK